MDLESLWYEVFPFLCGIAGGIVLGLSAGSLLMKVAAILLIVASCTILRVRWLYRRSLYVHLPSMDDLVKPAEAAAES